MATLKIRSWFGFFSSMLAFVVIGFLMVFYGRTVLLQCSYLESTQVTCVKKVKIMGLFQVEEETIGYVKGARVATHSCSRGSCTYRVELETPRGYVPMTTMYSTGQLGKQIKVAMINAYVAAGEEGMLKVADRSGLIAGFAGLLFLWIGLHFTIFAISNPERVIVLSKPASEVLDDLSPREH